jgi:hypothetical protein
MWWRFIKSLPKVALIVGVFVVSTGLFLYWYYFRSPEKMLLNMLTQQQNEKVVQEQAVKVEQHIGRVVLLDDDVYDLDTGEPIFQRWLRDGTPLRVYYDAENKKMVAFYGGGFVRYAMTGDEETRLAQKFPMWFYADFSSVLFAKDKDIWRADVDWNGWKLVNEKQVTSIKQINEAYFSKNIVLATQKTLLLHNGFQLLHVGLETGQVKPSKFSLQKLSRRRSPDSKHVVGLERGQLYCFDVDEDETKTLPVGRVAFSSYQWIGNDRCLLIESEKAVMIYDRLKHTLSEVAALPEKCDKFGETSPNGRLVFCIGRKGVVLVDIDGKKAEAISGGKGIGWVNEDSFAYSRETPDSELRGTWMQKPGGKERRIWAEPYVPARSGKSVLPIKSAGLVVFVTKEGVMRMKPDGTEIQVVKNLAVIPGRAVQLPSRLQEIVTWKTRQASIDDDDATEK